MLVLAVHVYDVGIAVHVYDVDIVTDLYDFCAVVHFAAGIREKTVFLRPQCLILNGLVVNAFQLTFIGANDFTR